MGNKSKSILDKAKDALGINKNVEKEKEGVELKSDAINKAESSAPAPTLTGSKANVYSQALANAKAKQRARVVSGREDMERKAQDISERGNK